MTDAFQNGNLWLQGAMVLGETGPVEVCPNPGNLILRLARVGSLPHCPGPVCPDAHSPLPSPSSTRGDHKAGSQVKLPLPLYGHVQQLLEFLFMQMRHHQCCGPSQ